MRTLLITIAVLLATAATAAVTRADPVVTRDQTGGVVESELVAIEVLTPRGEREIRTPEGFIRVESGGEDDPQALGSFGTYHAAAFAAVVSEPAPPADQPIEAPAPLRPDGMVDTSAPASGDDPCRAQRGRYLRRLLRMTGVDVDRPLELLDGLAGPGGHGGGNLLISGYLMPGVDAVRPLAWDQELRSIARDLSTCEARSAPAQPR